MVVLGVNAYHGDASAALLVDGKLVAAVEEERFRRVKHWAGFPAESIQACLKIAGISSKEIDRCAISRHPRAHLLRKALFVIGSRPKAGLIADRMRNALRLHSVADRLGQGRVHCVEHHPSHLASSFFVSPFGEAAVCAIDGFGDFVSTSFAVGRGSRLSVFQRVYFPHSLGIFYLALTQYLGFLKYGDEYKVMGLSAYGKPDYASKLRQLIRLKPEGTFELDLSYFRHHADGVTMTWEDGEPTLGPVYTEKLEKLLGLARHPENPIEPHHEAIAASLQIVFEETLFHILNALHRRTKLSHLCLAGGCALNSVANGKIRERTSFKEVYIQPAAADNGTALGAAFYVYHQVLGRPRSFVMDHAYWGPTFEDSMNLDAAKGCRVVRMEGEEELCRWTAKQLAHGKIVGWFQDRMEWGARALGNRSILADPRRAHMRELLNAKIKFRENFRPFAPSILEERVHDFFVGAVPDPFMIQVYPIQPHMRSVIPAVTHVDGSGRLQSVSRHTNPLYWKLLKAFEQETGVPILLNTSFNENEPIVCTPREAVECFLRTDMDVLVIGKTRLEKSSNGLG